MGGLAVALAASGVGGSGTLNRIAKFTPDGLNLGDSLLSDNGTNVTLTSGQFIIAGGNLEVTGALKLKGSTSGTITHAVPAAAGTVTVEWSNVLFGGSYISMGRTGMTSANYAISTAPGLTRVNNETQVDLAIANAADASLSLTATALTLLGADFLLGANYMEVTERAAPTAPAANKVRIYGEDNGAGKTRLMALFATGAAQQIALEP